MYLSFFVSLLSFSPLSSLVGAQIILDRQCWHEFPLEASNILSLPSGYQELAIPVHFRPNAVTSWSHPVICTEVLQSINDKLCVYTSTEFAADRGISIFTTPALAQQFLSLLAFRDQAALAKVNTPTNTYHAASIPNKGMGMLATRPLGFGDVITSYTPAFIAYLESELGTMEREKIWRTAIEQLPRKIREEFLGLSYVYGDERVRVQDIVKGNTFQLEVGGVNHLAIWPETSRANHACNPNAQYVIDTETLTHTVRATRAIAVGEEITISYTSPLDPTPQRQSNLQFGFHFTCTCPRCTSPTSDATLIRIHLIQSQLNDWSSTSPSTPELAELLLSHYEHEGLEGFMDIAYGFAALAYSAAGKAERARFYAERARRAVLMKDGRWSENFGIWEGMLRGGVEGHWSWGRKV